MNRILIWDLPTRLFHWTFAVLLTASIALALVSDEGGTPFQWHMLCGLAAVALLALRFVSGIAGSRHARFASFPVGPREIARYFGGIVSGKAPRYPGHNPGSALAAVAMFLLVAALVLTGVGFGGEAAEEIHGPLAYALIGVIVLHLAGLFAHTLRHRENIGASMLTGRKAAAPEHGLATAHPVWGLAFLLAGLAWTAALFSAHDARAATTRLPLTDLVITLGEKESHGQRTPDGKRDRRSHDDD